MPGDGGDSAGRGGQPTVHLYFVTHLELQVLCCEFGFVCLYLRCEGSSASCLFWKSDRGFILPGWCQSRQRKLFSGLITTPLGEGSPFLQASESSDWSERKPAKL